MRIRTIKPEFWTHPVMAQLPPETQLMAIALISWSDDHGYFEAEPRQVRGGVMPFRDDLATIERDIARLGEEGFVEVRQTERGLIGRVVKFAEHQRVEKPKASKLQKYFETGRVDDESGTRPGRVDDESTEEGKGREGKGGGPGREVEWKGKGETSAAKRPKKPTQPELPVIPPKPPPPPGPVAKMVEACATVRVGKLVELGLDPDAYPDQAPDFGVTGAFWAALKKRMPGLTDDDLVEHGCTLHQLWLDEETYWARTTDKEGKPVTPYPWGAFVTPRQWGKTADKHFPPEAA